MPRVDFRSDIGLWIGVRLKSSNYFFLDWESARRSELSPVNAVNLCTLFLAFSVAHYAAGLTSINFLLFLLNDSHGVPKLNQAPKTFNSLWKYQITSNTLENSLKSWSETIDLHIEIALIMVHSLYLHLHAIVVIQIHITTIHRYIKKKIAKFLIILKLNIILICSYNFGPSIYIFIFVIGLLKLLIKYKYKNIF